MRSISISLLGLLLISFSAFSTPAKNPRPIKQASYSGYMVDKMCSAGVASGSDAYQKAARHDKTCLVEAPCLSSGFGLVTPAGKWLPFDAAGDQKASKVALLTSKQDHIAVTVKGTMRDGTLYVSQIAER